MSVSAILDTLDFAEVFVVAISSCRHSNSDGRRVVTAVAVAVV